MIKIKKRLVLKKNDLNTSIDILDTNIQSNIQKIKDEFGDSNDLIIKSYRRKNCNNLQHSIIYIDDLVDKACINNLSLELSVKNGCNRRMTADCYFNELINSIAGFLNTKENSEFELLYECLLSGYCILLVDGCNRYFAIDTYLPDGRNVNEPTSQTVIRGPKEGFTEKISVNIGLVRKRIMNKNIRVEKITIGNVTKTKVEIMYIENIAKNEIVFEINSRLKKITIDGVLDSGYIEELIKDDRYSFFPTILNSEKPDSVAAALLEGKVAIFVDGTAFVLTVPSLFIEFFQSSEDYYHNYIISSMIRVFRYFALLLTLLVPSVYVALVTFHQEMIPTPLLISIAAQREGVPFPALAEALLMEATFEILREAGIRMPRAIGPAISIVGALVLGQAAVEAGIISAAIVIVVSITAISSFAIPNYTMSNAIRVIRFIFMLLAGTFGLYGVFIGLIVLTLHLCKLKTIGIPYLSPVTPYNKNGIKDTIIRFPLWKMTYRPSEISNNTIPRVNSKSPVNIKQKENPEIR